MLPRRIREGFGCKKEGQGSALDPAGGGGPLHPIPLEFYPRAFSTHCFSTLFGAAPTFWLTGWPSLNRISVGMPRTA